MAFHTQGQRFNPHQGIVGALRVHGHAQIAQTNSDPVKGEGQRAKGLGELKAVIGRLGL